MRQLKEVHRDLSHYVGQANQTIYITQIALFLFQSNRIVLHGCHCGFNLQLFSLQRRHISFTSSNAVSLCHHSEWVLIRQHHLMSCLSRYGEYLPKIVLACNYPGD